MKPGNRLATLPEWCQFLQEIYLLKDKRPGEKYCGPLLSKKRPS